MTPAEWIVIGGAVILLWLGAIWFFVADARQQRGKVFDWAALDYRPEKTTEPSDEVRRWEQAAERTYQRQGIRRNR